MDNSDIKKTSPKVIEGIYYAIFFFIVLSEIAYFITAIAFWSDRNTVGFGHLFFWGGLFVSAFAIMANHVVFSVVFDIKAIRNSLEKSNGESNADTRNARSVTTPSQEAVKNTPAANTWKCPKCGTINQNYAGTCGCGESKPRS